MINHFFVTAITTQSSFAGIQQVIMILRGGKTQNSVKQPKLLRDHYCSPRLVNYILHDIMLIVYFDTLLPDHIQHVRKVLR